MIFPSLFLPEMGAESFMLYLHFKAEEGTPVVRKGFVLFISLLILLGLEPEI